MIASSVNPSLFKTLFDQLLPRPWLLGLLRRAGPAKRRPPKLRLPSLLLGLIFHVVAGSGTLAQHVRQITGQSVTDSDLSQRREKLPWELFEQLMAGGLRVKADPQQHPEAFYQGLRLVGTDGSRFSVANTPPIKKQLRKAKTRRQKAAFAKVGVVVMVELGLHNPIAAAIGPKQESEMALAEQLWVKLPAESLLISDRYYGVAKVLVQLRCQPPEEGRREFLVRVRSNLKRKVLEIYPDGSALVELKHKGRTLLVREIVGRVRRGRSGWSSVRLWTSLLDWKRYPASELLALYARRWEQESFYRELKVDMRSTTLVQSHTPLTAAQEIAALILAYALLVDERLKAAQVGQVPVLRISFLKTLEAVRGLWRFLEVSADLMTPEQVRLVVQRTLRQIAAMAIPKRRQRSCPRAVRQPVRSWPRLLKNTYQRGAPQYELSPIRTDKN